MENATTLLIVPITHSWQELSNQFKVITSIFSILKTTVEQPSDIKKLLANLNSESQPNQQLLDEYSSKLEKLSLEAFNILANNQHNIFYPLIISSWTVLETNFDDLILRILINDENIHLKLDKKGIKSKPIDSSTREIWAQDTYRRIKEKVRNKKKISGNNGIFITHKLILEQFDINLIFDGRTQTLEELHQVRNCIAHSQGIIRDIDVLACPRFSIYLGKKIPLEDSIFTDGIRILLDYTFSWITAISYSPYMEGAMLKGSQNPFSKTDT